MNILTGAMRSSVTMMVASLSRTLAAVMAASSIISGSLCSTSASRTLAAVIAASSIISGSFAVLLHQGN